MERTLGHVDEGTTGQIVERIVWIVQVLVLNRSSPEDIGFAEVNKSLCLGEFLRIHSPCWDSLRLPIL